ncbi:protein FAM160B1 isoform X2 [Nilaparvata lugens]|uniref:protein FAM160B1 isoform X2 n=1 Tax=Nilaparvata lugens TaxID=108931 RepID=UPI00193D5D16|nr:protein FAM160B1 isoform X2 [Nilaparvata lugens]
MLGRFSVVFQNAVDALAPPTPLHEDFIYHWKRLMKHYLAVSSYREVPIELTNIPAHLDQLQKILQKEDEESKDEKMGPCVEYLLQHSLLDLLATLAASDDPPGMKQYVLQFVTRTVVQIKAPILGHVSVFTSLQVPRTPTLDRRSSVDSEASSHYSVSSAFLSNPLLANGSEAEPAECYTPPLNNPLFRPYIPSPRSRTPKLLPAATSATSGSVDEGCDIYENSSDIGLASETDDDPVFCNEFMILDSLLSYLDSADSKIRLKVCQGIMLLVSLPDSKFVNTVLQNSQICLTIASKLCSLLVEIPPTLDPNLLDELHVSWGLDVPVALETCATANGYREALAFFTWFDYCDQLIKEAQLSIADGLASSLRTHFFVEIFPAEDFSNILFLSIICKCFKMASAPALNREMSIWMVGESREPVSRDNVSEIMSKSLVKAALLNCFNEDTALSLESLRLFEVLLEKGNEHVLHCLVITYVNRRLYLDQNASASQIASWSDEEDEREKNRETNHSASEYSEINQRLMTPEANSRRALASGHIDKIVNSFLNVVPFELRSAPSVDNSCYQQYVSESSRQYSKVMAACQSFEWAKMPPNSSHSHTVSQCQFYEGFFLEMLFKLLRNLPNQAYEINLQLTAVISRLSLLPHPFLHEYLLNPLLNRKPGSDSLVKALGDVAAHLLNRVCEIPDYKVKLINTRHRLLGDIPEETNVDCSLLESIVVLEELCKELAAIAYVKFHSAT